MDDGLRTCSECSKRFQGSPQAKTCSPSCRTKRSRRLKRLRDEEDNYVQTHGELADEARAAVRRELTPDIIARVASEEIRPIVREAMTEDVLHAINDLIGLTPFAVKAIEKDLQARNAQIRQRAYALLLRYTAGHPAILQPKDNTGVAPLQINFNIPRPDAAAIEASGVTFEPVEEFRDCDTCHESKPDSEFAGASNRCLVCFARMKEDVLREHGLA